MIRTMQTMPFLPDVSIKQCDYLILRTLMIGMEWHKMRQCRLALFRIELLPQDISRL